MHFLAAVVVSAGCAAVRQRHVDAGVVPVAPGLAVSVALPAVPATQREARVALACSEDARRRLHFGPGLGCGESAVLSPAKLSAFLAAFKAKLRAMPAAGETLTAQLELAGEGVTTHFSLNFTAFERVPAAQLATELPAVTATPLRVLRVGAGWPRYQPLEVALEGELASAARGYVEKGQVYIVFDRLEAAGQLRVTLRHAQSGLASQSFAFALKPTPLQWARAYALAAGLAGCMLLLGGLVVLALPGRARLAAKAAPAAAAPASKAIDDWNRSFVAASFSTIKTEDDSFSTVGSNFADAHVSMRSNFGLFFSPTVDLIELPAEFAVSV